MATSLARAIPPPRTAASVARSQPRRRAHGGAASPLSEITATLSHMELTMSRAGRPLGSRLDGAVIRASPSVSSHHMGSTPSKQQTLAGPTDAAGAALRPRSRYLQDIVSPPPVAPPHHHGHGGSSSTASMPSTAHHHHYEEPVTATGATPAVKSSMLRRLEEEMKECTFAPNPSRRPAKSAEPPKSRDGIASPGPPPPQRSKSAAAAAAPGTGETSIFERLHQKRTHHLSRHLETSLDASVDTLHRTGGGIGRSPTGKVPARPAKQLERCPFGPPSRPVMDKELATLGASAKERPRKKVTSRDPVPRIFQRLHQDAALVDEKRKAADRSIEHKQTVSRQHALSTVERWAALEREREERVAALRRRREEDEQRYLEAKRREISEHVHRGPAVVAASASGSTAPLPHGAAARAAKPPAAKVGGLKRPAAKPAQRDDARLVAPLHLTQKSTGGESGMVLTPNGTWRREAPSGATSESPAQAAGGSPSEAQHRSGGGAAPQRKDSGPKSSAAAAAGTNGRPPPAAPQSKGASAVKPLQLNRLRKPPSR